MKKATNYWFCDRYTVLEKTSKAVYRCKSIYRSADTQKWHDEKPLDPEEACKIWDCCEFIRCVKVSPPAKLIRVKRVINVRNKLWLYYCNGSIPELFIPVGFGVPKNTTKATKMEQSAPSTFITNYHEELGWNKQQLNTFARIDSNPDFYKSKEPRNFYVQRRL